MIHAGTGGSGIRASSLTLLAGMLLATSFSHASEAPNGPSSTAPSASTPRPDSSLIYCVATAMTDSFGSDGGHAILLPSLGGKYVFPTNATGLWTVNSDGTATLTGTVRQVSDPTHQFVVNVTFSGRVNPDDGIPAGSPKLELLPGAYVSHGGPVNPATWIYYTSFTGTLTGTGGNAGTTLTVTRVGPAFQVGLGASGKNVGYGASGWFVYAGENPHENSDFNFDIRACAGGQQPGEKPKP